MPHPLPHPERSLAPARRDERFVPHHGAHHGAQLEFPVATVGSKQGAAALSSAAGSAVRALH